MDILKEEEDGDDVRFNWVVDGGGGGKEMVEEESLLILRSIDD